MAQLIRTDKNGTKYYVEHRCWKCNGKGYIHGYEHVFGGICFDCNGSGIADRPRTYKEYTPEYAAKLAERRRSKALAKAPEANRKFFEKEGFDENGITYVVIGDTYSIKDELKESGAKFNNLFGWHFNHADNGYNCFEVNISEVGTLTDVGTWMLNEYHEVIDYVKSKRDEFAPKSDSKYIAEVGETVKVNVTLMNVFTYKTHFSYYGETNYIYKFADEQGNVIVWKTSSGQDVEEGKNYTIKGKVKELSEYKGERQTVLTRCRITQ